MLLWLPKDILLNIFSKLSIQDILKCGLVCKRWLVISEQIPINLNHSNNFVIWSLSNR